MRIAIRYVPLVGIFIMLAWSAARCRAGDGRLAKWGICGVMVAVGVALPGGDQGAGGLLEGQRVAVSGTPSM